MFGVIRWAMSDRWCFKVARAPCTEIHRSITMEPTTPYSEHQKRNSGTCYCDIKGKLFFIHPVFPVA